MTAARVQRVVTTLADHDPQFVALCRTLYGPDVCVEDVLDDAYVSKLDDASEVHVPGSNAKRSQARTWALRLGVLGGTAGGVLGIKDGSEGALMASGRAIQRIGMKPKVVKVPVSATGRVRGAGKVVRGGLAAGADAVGGVLSHKEQKKTPQPIPVKLTKGFGNPGVSEMVKGILASSRRVTGALMEHSGLNDKMATGGKHAGRVPVARKAKVQVDGKTKTADQLSMFDTQGKPSGSSAPGGAEFNTARGASTQEAGAMIGRGVNRAQDFSTKSPQHTAGVLAAGGLGGAALVGHHEKKKQARMGYYAEPAYFGKRDEVDIEFTGKVSKLDTDKRLAFGWCSVSKINGQTVKDRQGDILHIEDTEDAAYDYNINSRMGGSMHMRTDGVRVYPDTEEKPGDRPVHVADLVESMVFTPEKIAKMGLPDDFPQGWWIGMRYQTTPEGEAAWQDVKTGKHPGFSIHGKGIRVPVMA